MMRIKATSQHIQFIPAALKIRAKFLKCFTDRFIVSTT